MPMYARRRHRQSMNSNSNACWTIIAHRWRKQRLLENCLISRVGSQTGAQKASAFFIYAYEVAMVGARSVAGCMASVWGGEAVRLDMNAKVLA